MINVFLNEKFIGTTTNPIDFIKKIKEMRVGGKLPETVNVRYNKESNRRYKFKTEALINGDIA